MQDCATKRFPSSLMSLNFDACGIYDLVLVASPRNHLRCQLWLNFLLRIVKDGPGKWCWREGHVVCNGRRCPKIPWICVEFHSVGRDGNWKKRRYAIPSVMNFSRSGVERWHSHFVRGFWTQKLSFGWNGWTFDEHEVFFQKDWVT